MDFEKELAALINKCSVENSSDTPDFILAKYLSGCLENFAETTRARDKWYGDERWKGTKETSHEEEKV